MSCRQPPEEAAALFLWTSAAPTFGVGTSIASRRTRP
jgi:hypothetical protein